MKLLGFIAAAGLVALAPMAEAYTSTRCTTIGNVVRCTTIGGGTYTTTRCTTVGGTVRCTSY